MSFPSDLYAYLISVTALTDLVEDRIYPGKAPEKAVKPYIVHYNTGTETSQHQLGVENSVNESRVVDVVAADSVTADNVSEQVKEALDGYQLKNMRDTYISSCFLTGENDSSTFGLDGSDDAFFRKILTFTISRNRSVPTP